MSATLNSTAVGHLGSKFWVNEIQGDW